MQFVIKNDTNPTKTWVQRFKSPAIYFDRDLILMSMSNDLT
jgi:hypothetical protein